MAGEGTRRFGPRSGGARRTPALVLLAACAAASAAGGLWALAGLEDAGRLVRHTGEVIGEAESLLGALVDAETGQRGFLLTGEERYLEPYRAALGRVGPALDRLRGLVADNPAQRARLPALRAGAEAKLAELAETIARRQAGDADSALAIVRTDLGKRTMDGLRARVAGFEAEERRLLDARVAEAARRGALATGLVGLAGLLAAAAGVLAALKTARAERALSEQEAHARAILDLSPQVLWTARRDGGIEDFAERWLEWTGLTRAEALGESWARVPHPDDLPRVAAAWSHALATGQPYDSEHRIRMADGSYRWMRSRAVPRRDPASDAVLRWYGATEDVHDRHEAEAALREGEARFRATFEQAAVGMAHVALDGTWLRVNHRLCTKLGYTAAELRARTFQDITHPDDLEADINNARRLLAGEVANYSMEKRYIRKDGATLWAELTVALVRDAAGAPLYFISAIANISARKAAETALRDLAATLEARVGECTRQLSEVVAALDAFASSVSHDLRAPLRAMEGFARILLEDHAEALGPEGRRYAGRIVAAAARMEGLIQDLLAYSRLSRDAVELVPVELDRAVDRAVAELREGGAPGGAQAEVAVRRPMPRVLASRVVLGQILANLLSNAAKFTLPDQPARIRAWAEERPGDRVRLWVEDEGIGLAPGHLGRVFNVFERLHGQETYPGTGIGLAIVR
ncbi:MAG: PAS domain S-box protein, partial [Acetobacteraceae bacterium]|nr:PAS domain S-box protein [Acetobacteraceae bacterium]